MLPRGQDSQSLQNQHGRRAFNSRAASVVVALTLLLLTITLAVTGLGPVRIPPSQVASTLANHLLRLRLPVMADCDSIVWQLRLPRILLEILVGASLATAGVAFQALLRNPLAEPYIIGVSSGASVGVGLVIVFGAAGALGGYAMPAASFAGAASTLLLVYGLARVGGRVDVRSLLLSGVIAGAFLWAVQMLLFRLARKNDDEILAWMMGSLSSARWQDVALLAVLGGLGMVAVAVHARSMNLYALGEDSARHLGLEPEPFKAAMVLLGSLLTASTVSVSGIIGFVGLIVPHLARRITGTSDHRIVLPASALGGAIMMELADTITRLAFGGELLPVGAVTALLGCPFFFYLLRRKG